MFITYIDTELKHNLKCGEINVNGSNLRELLTSTKNEPDEDIFIPASELLIDLNASIFH